MSRGYSYNNKDRTGRKTGRTERDLFGGGYTHYDSRGKKTGTSRENLFGGGYTHYDAKGRKTGSSRENLFGGGYTNYDNRGRKTGTTNRDVFGGSYTHRDARGNKTGSSTEGCYIATCVYGSYDCPEVLVLRRFRDNVLKRSLPGRWFISVYYAVSPKLVGCFGNCAVFRKFWRTVLDALVQRIK